MPSITPSSSSFPRESSSEDSPSPPWKLNQVGHHQDYSFVTSPSSAWYPSPWPVNKNSESRRPCLINLSPGNTQQEYHLQSGVTMLGTGKGCLKFPEIILEGPEVAPQHCFIERLNIEDENEVILHPISELTAVDEVPVSSPTPLVHGNIINVGDSHRFMFQGIMTTIPQSQYKTIPQSFNQFKEPECPYAVVVKKKGRSNPLSSTTDDGGDVNKNSFHTINNIMETSATRGDLHRHQSHSNNGCNSRLENESLNPRNYLLRRQKSFDDDYYDNCYPYSLAEDETRKYRDGLESDNFSSKVARFEFIANNHHQEKSNGDFQGQNGRILPPSQRCLPLSQDNTRVTGMPKSVSSGAISDTIRRRPSPYFTRFGTSSEFRYFSEDNENDCIVHSSEAVPTIGYRRAYSTSSAISGSQYDAIPFVRSNTMDDSKTQVNRFSPNNETSQSCNTLSLFNQSSPSPDSMYSSHSSNSTYGNYCSTPIDPKNFSKDHPSHFIVYEELSDPRVRQTRDEERHFSSRNSSTNRTENLELDEVLAICEEYEQQIAREIEEKKRRSNSSPSNDKKHQTPKIEEGNQANNGPFNAKLPPLPPISHHHHNGTTSSNLGYSKAEVLHSNQHVLNDPHGIKRSTEKEPIIVQAFNTSIAQYSLHNGTNRSSNNTSYSDDVFTPVHTSSPHSQHRPYENVTEIHAPSIPKTDNISSSDVVDGAHSKNPSNQNGSHDIPPDLPPKSKLSVSFSPSVEEYNIDDEIPRVSSSSSSPKSNAELTSRLKSPQTNGNANSSVIKTKVQIHAENLPSGDRFHAPCDPKHLNSENDRKTICQTPIPPTQVVQVVPLINVIQYAERTQAKDHVLNSSSSKMNLQAEDPISRLKSQIREVEQQEMEALREMEIEKALLVAEEKSLETQLEQSKAQLEELKNRLAQIDGGIRLWKIGSSQELLEMKRKISVSEKDLQRLEKLHEEFCGSADEETLLLEKLKFQHEFIEKERKNYEDAEFHQMEESVNKESQKDELTKLFGEAKRKLSLKQNELDELRNQNLISVESSAKEIQNLEKRRQNLILELQKCRESKTVDTLIIPEILDMSSSSSVSDSDDGKNCDLEEKLKALTLLASSADDAMTIELIKSNSPIDPKLGNFGAKTTETLRKMEKDREYLLNEQGVQMMENERQRVRELQKRVQAAVREEWEAAKRNRSNQCHSLNSVGSEESSQTISDTPTDSGSGDDATDKSTAPSLSTTDVSFNGNSNGVEESSFQLCQQMRHRQKDLSDETRPVSDGTVYDNRTGSIVALRDKHRAQNNRPLTRYLPVRGDEDHFDLRVHIERDHQLSLCPQVIITSSVAKGFLLKLGSRFHNWNKRWFVFDRETRTFSYYIDKSEKKPRGGIHFQAIQEVYVDHLQSVKSPSPKLTFCVKTYNRVFHLVAPTPEAMRIWVDIIFTGAEGYQEFKSVS